MPRNVDTPMFKSPFIKRTGQSPLTRLLPLDQEVRAEIVDVQIPSYLQTFVSACHRARFDDPAAWSEAEMIKYIGSGKTLWQCLELVRFGVKNFPVSRVFSHQLVRARVGVSYSQQCTGDVDCRHLDFIVPQCWYRNDRKRSLEAYKSNCLMSKMDYAMMVDLQESSIQEARYVLPSGLVTFLMMEISLGALAELYNKRTCTMTQTWEMVIWARSLRKEIERVAPWALTLFRGCENGCWFHKTVDTPFANTHLWAPDGVHDKFDWNPASFIHGLKTHAEVSSGPDAEVQHYDGTMAITKEEWNERAQHYGLRGPTASSPAA